MAFLYLSSWICGKPLRVGLSGSKDQLERGLSLIRGRPLASLYKTTASKSGSPVLSIANAAPRIRQRSGTGDAWILLRLLG